MKLEKCKVISNKNIIDNKYVMKVEANNLELGLAGQFYMIEAQHKFSFLKRPISLHAIDKNILEFYYETKGDGTKSIASLQPNDVVEIQGPLGTGFSTDHNKKNIIVIGGGMGIAPIKGLINQLVKSNCVTFLAGGRDKNALKILESFNLGNVKLIEVTDDGSAGEKMNTAQKLSELVKTNKYDLISCCGPQKMMEAIGKIAKENNIDCEVSLETRMACGVKACVGCSVKTTEGMKRVCHDGPVFNSKIIIEYGPENPFIRKS